VTKTPLERNENQTRVFHSPAFMPKL
jgi:hypothetical protein